MSNMPQAELPPIDNKIEENSLIPPDRIKAKTEGAIAWLRFLKVDMPSDLIEMSIMDKVKLAEKLIQGDPNQLFAGEKIGEVIIDKDGHASISSKFSQKGHDKIALRYVSVEAAVSSLYTSSSNVDPLPPEAFSLDLNKLANEIDSNGVLLTVVGAKQEQLKTRFFTIPGQQLDVQRKPIPPNKQKILVVQDNTLIDGRIERIYSVSTSETLTDELDLLIKAQNRGIDSSAEAKSAQTESQDTRILPSSPRLDNQPVIVGDTIIGSKKVSPGGVEEDPSLRWLRGINDVSARTDIPDTQKSQKIQEIVDAAKVAGVDPDKIKIHLQTLGIHTIDKEQLPKIERYAISNSLTGHDLNLLKGFFNVLYERAIAAHNQEEVALLRGLDISILGTSELWSNPEAIKGKNVLEGYQTIEAVLENLRKRHEVIDQSNFDSTAIILPPEEVSQPIFRVIENRVETSRVAHKTLSGEYGEPRQTANKKAVQTLEKDAKQRNNGRTETMIDVRGYQPQKLRKTYTLPDGRSVTEEMVAFVRRNSKSQWEWLLDANKNAIVINADTYDVRVQSNVDPQGTFTIVKHNEFGSESGVITLIT